MHVFMSSGGGLWPFGMAAFLFWLPWSQLLSARKSGRSGFSCALNLRLLFPLSEPQVCLCPGGYGLLLTVTCHSRARPVAFNVCT